MQHRMRIERAMCAVALCFASGKAGAQPASPETEIARRVQTYFGAMGKGQLATIEQALAPDYLVIGGDGKLETRAERLAWLRANTTSLVAITPTQLRVRVYGNSAIATGLVTIPADAMGPAIQERFTQVWIRRDGVWRMVSGQITIVRT
ncbi:MAG: nuclear transport factor 2 family protein [Gemmatimonadaceae bacterium]|nr:nuclear transport factor 2 family protein [Gemmatimonadaceae bacterium]